MSTKSKHEKKGKNFKEFITDEKKKGQTSRKIMRLLTSINSDVMYSGSFLLVFAPVIALVYVLFSPSVFLWAGVLIGVAICASLFANYVTKVLKHKQWKYASH
jgi:hypothetical protein